MVPDATTGGFHPRRAAPIREAAHARAKRAERASTAARASTFRFSTLGQLAAIGRGPGCANVFGITFLGLRRVVVWRTIYLSKLPRFEKKLRVALDWTLDLAFAKDFASFEGEARPVEIPVHGADALGRRLKRRAAA